jgi:hypothetical protein
MADQKSDVHVEFFSDPVKHETKSREAGRPIFTDAEFVRIRWPGDRNRELVAPANQPSVRNPDTNEWLTYIDRYPRHYEAFKQNATFIGEGAPIEEAPFLTKAQVAELKAVNIFTIESLAGLSESSMSKLGMGARKLMDQAKAYVEKAKDSALETKLAAQNADLREQLKALGAQVAALSGKDLVRTPTPEPDAPEDSDVSPFEGWEASQLKAYIKDKTGEAPRGNPSLETLMRMAEDARPAAA